MESNIISLALTAYALYSAIASRSKLDKQEEGVVDLQSKVDDLTAQVDELTTKTYTRIDRDIEFSYTLILGRPSDMNKLSGALHFTVRNKSDKNTYIVRAFQFVPTIGAAFCNADGENLFNLLGGVELGPGDSFSGRLSYNNLKIPRNNLGAINQKLLEYFNSRYGWDKLGDKDATVSGVCKADVWLLCGAPYIDTGNSYVIEKQNVAGDIRWHGGNYLPGNPKTVVGKDTYYNEFGTVMSFRYARKLFGLE